jgi:ribokinase
VEPFTKIAKSIGIKPFFIGKEEPSPYAVKERDKNAENKVLVYHGAQLSVKDVDCFSKQIKNADVLLINNEVPISVNERAVDIAKEHGVKVVFNPAPYRKSDKGFLDKIDLFTPNEHETEGLEDYKNVIVTLGDKGCFIKSTGESVPAQPTPNAVDTTGAGDTFNGVLAVCLSQGESIKKACEIASVASAIKVTKKYILNSIPTKSEIEKFLENKNG